MATASISCPEVRKAVGGRPTREASEALVDVILDVAWSLFVEDGYKRLSMDAIAKAASVSKRTIYDRFQSKEGLFEALVSRALNRWTAETNAIYDVNGQGDWLQPLVGHLLNLMGGRDYMALSNFVTTEGHAFPALLDRQRAAAELALLGFVEHFEARMEGYPRGLQGRLVARTVLAHISGWAQFFVPSEPEISEPARGRAFILRSERFWIFTAVVRSSPVGSPPRPDREDRRRRRITRRLSAAARSCRRDHSPPARHGPALLDRGDSGRGRPVAVFQRPVAR